MTSPLADHDGATAVEYALLAGLVAVVIAAAVGLLGTNLQGLFADPQLHDAVTP